MNHKYGTYDERQFEDYKKRLHSMVHWLLIYAENKDSYLEGYFTKVQCKLNGLNTLLMNPSELIEIMALIESAQNEYNSENYSHAVYRKLILDAHELIDKLR